METQMENEMEGTMIGPNSFGSEAVQKGPDWRCGGFAVVAVVMDV